MAIPVSFDESNHVLAKPADMTDEQCQPLSVWIGPNPDGLPTVISCWKLTAEELEEINKTKRVWLFISGVTMPPAVIGGESPWK